MFLWEFAIYTFQDLKTQFISFKLMFWHGAIPIFLDIFVAPQRAPAQQDLGTQIIDDPVFFRAK